MSSTLLTQTCGAPDFERVKGSSRPSCSTERSWMTRTDSGWPSCVAHRKQTRCRPTLGGPDTKGGRGQLLDRPDLGPLKFISANLRRADLSGADLVEANLSEVKPHWGEPPWGGPPWGGPLRRHPRGDGFNGCRPHWLSHLRRIGVEAQTRRLCRPPNYAERIWYGTPLSRWHASIACRAAPFHSA